MEVESAVPISGSLWMTWCASNIIFKQIICRSRRSINGIILIKMNANFERNCPGTSGGSNCCWRGCIENCPANSICPYSPGCSSAWLKRNDVQIVSKSWITGKCCTKCCYSRAQTPYRICKSRAWACCTDTEWRSSGGGGNYGRVAYGAITPGSSDADIVVLAGQMGLGGSDRASGSVPIEAGNRSCITFISLTDDRL